MYSFFAEIALVAAQLEQFQQLLKTRVILIILNLAIDVSRVLIGDHFVSARSLLIDCGEDYFSHKTVNRPFQFILLKSCSIRNGF